MSRASLRRRAYVVVLAVVVAPPLLVAIASWQGASVMRDLLASAEQAATTAAAERPQGGALEVILEQQARRHRVRLVALDAGQPLAQADHESERSLRDRLGDALFGPDGAPTLAAYNATREPIARWPEVSQALAEGRSSGCVIAFTSTLAVCHAAVRVAGTPERVVVAQKSSPRAIRALSDLRYPLLKLTLYVLLLGALLSAWLSWRLLSPVERLRREVLARALDPRHATPIPTVSRDEIGDLGDAFNVLLNELVTKNRLNEAFAADLAHELKSPIAALQACADGLTGPLDAARSARLARVLRDSTTRLDSLVSRFLEIARAEAGLPAEERAPLDLTALVRGVCAALAEDERYRDVRFEVNAEEVTLEGAVGPLETTLRNLLDNAASFAGQGGWVRATVTSRADEALLTIADSGPGIPPEHRSRVFDRFFTDRPDGRGTGLGLAYVRAAIEAHGGTIRAGAADGGGALFTVRLPLRSHGVHARSADSSPPR